MFVSDIIKDVLTKNGSKRDVKKRTLNSWRKQYQIWSDVSASYVDKFGTISVSEKAKEESYL